MKKEKMTENIHKTDKHKIEKSAVVNFTIEVLDFLLGIPESILLGFDRKEFYRQLGGMPTEKVLTTANICKLFHRFKKCGYIDVVQENGGESVLFTDKAKLAIIDKLAGRISSDSHLRFVSFDIPERMRTNRDKFRRAIKRLGFVQIQKSLWVCDKNVGDLVQMAAEEYRIDEYVVYIAANETNINSTIEGMINDPS